MWWTQDRPGAEHLVVHLLPLMLVRSLGPNSKDADVKRMHGCVTLFASVQPFWCRVWNAMCATKGIYPRLLCYAVTSKFTLACAWLSDYLCGYLPLRSRHKKILLRLRKALLLLDFEDESSDSLRALLLRLVDTYRDGVSSQ